MKGCTAVWRLDIVEARPALEAIDFELGLLSPPEYEIRDQNRLTTRRALRVLLRYFAGPDVARAEMSVMQDGRPELALADAPVFSITHSAGLALIALCEKAPLGIDLELQRPLKMSLARRTQLAVAARDAGFDVASALCAATSISNESDRQVLEVWTQLEALAKAQGGGIGSLLHTIGFRGRGGQGLAVPARSIIPEDAAMSSLSAGRDYVATLVHPRTHNVEQLREFPTSPDEIRDMSGSATG